MKPIAFVESRTGPVVKAVAVDWATLSKRLSECADGDKDGPAWLPADIAPGSRTTERVKSVSFLVLDIEAKAERRGDEKIITGPEPVDVAGIVAELALWGWRAIVHTSYSHAPEHPRYRLVFDPSRALLAAEMRPLALHVAALLGLADCVDTACMEPARLFYLPRCAAENLAQFQHASVEGETLPVDTLLADAQQIDHAQKSAVAGRHKGQTANVIDQFNQAHDIGLILEQHGYIQKGGKRWLWPGSTTGMAGVRLLPERGGKQMICSGHANDPLHAEKVCDVFDCWRILNHGGDVSAAVKAAARVMGLDRPAPATAAVASVSAEPEPLRASVPPAETYPVAALGDVLGSAASALHDAVKAPLALCCQSVLAAASLAVQAHYDIKLPWGERKPVSLFLLTVGESGERKSGIDDLVLGAAKAQQKAESEAYTIAQERYEADLAAWQQATDMARKSTTAGKKGQPQATAADVRAAVERCGDKPVAPIAPLRFVTDPTVEGLYKLLVVGQPSVALFSDEGGLLIGGHALNSDNALKTMARWCKLWDGSPFDRVRAGDGASVLYGRRMALHQLAQPEVMVKLLSDPMANGQGLLARCLVAWPESTIGSRHVERYEWAGERHELKRLFAVLKNLLEAPPRTGKSEQELDPVELPLSEAAAALAVAAGNQFETLMARGGDLAELRDRTSKALENACRIAAVLAVVEGGLSVREIGVEPLQRALVLVQWYLAEALRIRGAAAIPQSVSDAEMLSAWLRERGLKLFRSKQILNGGPNPLRNKPRLLAAVNELVVNGYLIENEAGEMVEGVKTRKSWKVAHHVV
jgi:hypothetical protein